MPHCNMVDPDSMYLCSRARGHLGIHIAIENHEVPGCECDECLSQLLDDGAYLVTWVDEPRSPTTVPDRRTVKAGRLP
jgi:hypothetical protein